MQELQDLIAEDAEFERLVNLAERNRDGEINAGRVLVAVATKGAKLSERVGGHPPEIVERSEIVRRVFEQEAVKIIDSLIALDAQEYKRDPKWAASMQKLHLTEGIEDHSASNVFMAL